MQVITSTGPKVLSASQIGFPCLRNLWYRANGYEELITPQQELTFEVGKALEPVIVNHLEKMGFYVHYNNKSHDDPPDFELELEGGFLTGRYDITFQHKNSPPPLMLGDIKTMNTAAFSYWKRYGTLKKYPQYADQLTAYWMGLTSRGEQLSETLALIGFDKNNHKIHIDYFPLDLKRWERIKQRCEYVFSLSEPPEPEEDKPHWACSYCGYKHVCEHYNPQKAQETHPEEITDEEVELAAYMLLEARQMKKEAKELENEAKEVLKRFKDKEIIKAGSYIVKFTVSKRSRVNEKALREERPDIYVQFAVERESLRIEVMEV